MICYTILLRIPSIIQPIIILIDIQWFECKFMTLCSLIKRQSSSILYSFELTLLCRYWLVLIIKSPIEIIQWYEYFTTSCFYHLNCSLRLISKYTLGILDRFYKNLDLSILEILFIWYLFYCYLSIS